LIRRDPRALQQARTNYIHELTASLVDSLHANFNIILGQQDIIDLINLKRDVLPLRDFSALGLPFKLDSSNEENVFFDYLIKIHNELYPYEQVSGKVKILNKMIKDVQNLVAQNEASDPGDIISKLLNSNVVDSIKSCQPNELFSEIGEMLGEGGLGEIFKNFTQ
jgi:hypothetical protein